MNATVTRDIVLDLWPAYEAGEASPDTRAVVETFLAGDPDFASVVRKVGEAVRRQPGLAVPPDERRMVEATRRRLARQRWLVGAAVLTSLFPLTFQFTQGRGPVFLYQTAPGVLFFLPVAAGLWLWLWRSTRP